MSEWKKVKLGDITDSCLGKMLDAARNRGEYKPYLANLNVRWGSFDTDRLSLMRFEEDENERYGIKYGDLIICEGGEPGRCAIWKEQLPDMKIQKALHRVRPKEELVDNFYLFYWFLLAGKRNWIDQYCTGATIKHLPGQKLKEVVVDLPPINVQHRIATILSRYDSLIENYQKQIKLLEEAAQRLYKEWFVDLHFPGYETTKIVDGVPEGWEKKKVGEVTPIKTGKKDANFGTENGEYPFFTCAQEPIKAPSYSYDTSAVILAGNGDFNVKLYRGKFEAYQRTYVLGTNHKEMLYLLYFCISENMNKLATGASGSTIKFLTKGMIESLDIYVPSKIFIGSFNKIIEPIQGQKEHLLSQIRLLTEARDRLLPKLMSGEIAV